MKLKLYHFMVNRHPGISHRYHKVHDGAEGAQRILSWAYLLWLNFAYYIMFCRFLGREPEAEIYESRNLPVEESESQRHHRVNAGLSVDAYVDRLKEYDLISFDIFDTLLLRPVGQPTDLFYMVGERIGQINFKNLRIRAEQEARAQSSRKNGHSEVTLEEIWQRLSQETGYPEEKGMRIEKETERNLCYANPFMLEVWRKLQALGKEMIVVSDMYLPEVFLGEMIEHAGFTGASKRYVSCEYGRNKASGSLFELIRGEYSGKTIIHVGDHPYSDGRMAVKNGMASLLYPNVNASARLCRAFDMSYMVGSAYRGVVSNHLYNGQTTYGMEYEYGFIYGGLFVLGYCGFIHDYYKKNQTDKLLFLSRDGDILKQAYDRLYPEDAAIYVYWSRKAAVKLMADADKHDYFRRLLDHKINQGYTIGAILHSMELDFLLEEMKESSHLKAEEILTDKNVGELRHFIDSRWDCVVKAYESQQKAAARYYESILKDCRRAAAVDIGWAGSGAISLSHLAYTVWNIPCEITGIIAGTNTLHNAGADAAEPFLQSGRLTAYLYSSNCNRDLWKKHDPNKDYNVFWELLLSSVTPQFAGFYMGNMEKESRGEESFRYMGELDISLRFGRCDANQEGIREIQRGILDFVQEYSAHFQKYPYMLRIGGRDAYAPMLVAASHHERYLKAIENKFKPQVNVD